MKKITPILILLIPLLSATTVLPSSSIVPGELLVKYRAGRYPRHLQGELGKIGWAKIKTGSTGTVHDTLEELAQQSDIEHVEPNTYGEFLSEPDDPSFGLQWYLPAIGAPEAWDKSLGENIIIGLVDSGVDLDHEDLADNVLADGWDFGDDDDDPGDELGHGTQVCGVVAAVQNNGRGISGVVPRSRILPLKISLENTDVFTDAAVGEAIVFAADRGASIINLSLGWNDGSSHQLVADAVAYAADKGATLVAAAGNSRGPVWFPANLESVIAVSAVDRNGQNEFSASGPELDLVAPGSASTFSDFIFTTALGGTYNYTHGTSFSAAIVSGVAALLLSEQPHFTNAQITKFLTGRADDLGLPGRDDEYGYGRVNALSTLDPLISSVFPARITGSSAIPVVYLLSLFGYHTRFFPLFSRVTFNSEHLISLGLPVIAFPQFLLQPVMLKKNPPEGFIDLTVTTGTDEVEGYDAIYIALPPRSSAREEGSGQARNGDAIYR